MNCSGLHNALLWRVHADQAGPAADSARYCEKGIARSAAERCADLALPTPRAATVFCDFSSPDTYQLPV